MLTRALQAADAAEYRSLMLQAYALAADAFTSTPAERATASLDWWRDRAASSDGLRQAFGAYDDDRLVGTIALEYASRTKTRHKGLIIGMYVMAAHRRQGIAAALLSAAIAHARQRGGLLALQLELTEGNHVALALYEGAGFVTYGVEPLALLTPGGFRAKIHMQLDLAADSPRRD